MSSAKDNLVAESYTPPLKWAGGKRWLLPRLQAVWSPHRNRRLVEPFAGGLSVALGLNPDTAILNDINVHLINFYQWIRDGLVVELDLENDKDYYYAARKRFNALIKEELHETPEAAQLFYYLNRTGYNGLCRFNRSGLFNVPFGRFKSINYAEDFLHLQDALSKWEFLSLDFDQLPIENEDFLYVDPPYDVEFTSYSSNGFNWADQVRLVEWLQTHPGPIVASNQATARILELYEGAGFTIEVIKAPRRISRNGDRTPADEMLAFRNV